MNRHLFLLIQSSLMICLLTWSALCLVASPSAAAPGLTTLVRFDDTDGAAPVSNLVLAQDGNFYGTTREGGIYGQDWGTIFKLNPAGTLTTLYEFTNGTDGAYPTGLVEGSDGNFYGATNIGGTSKVGTSEGDGTVFKITPAGALTTLADFNGKNGAFPLAGLVQGSDDNFYGTTSQGGTHGDGTVFKITPTGTLSILTNFNRTNGQGPAGTLIQGSDGDFYGTTEIGGSANEGTVFKITPTGTLTTVVAFNGANGAYALAGLVQGDDGNFYGTTSYGGPSHMGVIFKVTPTGTLTTLVNFTGKNGSTPLDSLTVGSDGNFYGTTDAGGSANDGTIFKLAPAGVLTTLYTFMSGADGIAPQAGLTEYSDGVFYGTTGYGADGNGTVFKYALNDLAPSVTSFSPSEGPVGSTVTLTGTNLNGATAVRFHEADAKYFTSSADGTRLTVTVPYAALKGTITVTTPGGSVKTATPFRITYAPVITSFSPMSGPVGTVVTITGTHLDGITRVRFHNADATIYSSNADGTQLTVTVPPGAATGTITLDNRNALATTSVHVFTVTP